MLPPISILVKALDGKERLGIQRGERKMTDKKVARCWRCGRSEPEFKIKDGLCQWHRGSDTRHMNIVRNLQKRGAPTLADLRKK